MGFASLASSPVRVAKALAAGPVVSRTKKGQKVQPTALHILELCRSFFASVRPGSTAKKWSDGVRGWVNNGNVSTVAGSACPSP